MRERPLAAGASAAGLPADGARAPGAGPGAQEGPLDPEAQVAGPRAEGAAVAGADEGPSTEGARSAKGAWRRRLRAAWPWLRYLLGLGIAALALWALEGRRGELSGATHYLAHVKWEWLWVAIAAEVASLVAFGLMQRSLLAAGGVRMGVARVTALTFAATAIANSMPAGPVLSSVFAFRQYRRRGADEAFAGWTLVAVFVAASVSLALVAAAGLAVAGAEGAGFDLVWVTVGVLVVAVAMGALFLQRRALIWLASRAVRTCRQLLRWPSVRAVERADRLVEHLNLVELTPGRVLAVMGWALLNWVLDCACLGLSFLAVGVGVPWKALLLAYGAGQLAVNLPITPGGLGVVEGSLTIALVTFGGPETATVAAVLLYRIISFWGELPVGWAAWGGFAWSHRRRERAAVAAAGETEIAGVSG